MASDSPATTNNPASRPVNFIRHIIDDDQASQRHGGKVVTRFPPEPNGYLHIGHAKSICLNFGIARDYNGVCHLRFDDTNPEKESDEYVRAIKEDVSWLGFDWDDKLFHASDHFEFLYESALKLVQAGKAYVDEQSAEDIRNTRGTLTEPGTPSPWRDRPIDENVALFERMRAGEFKDGKRVVRAKIDMASGNMSMRDPVIYRIRHITHHRTGDAWCIYPMYDFTHCLSDANEGVTHSLCTLEFEDNRALYDWVLENVGFEDPPRQYEFSRLNLEFTLMSKRFLNRLVVSNLVDGWDDPRMPTISGLRRRGYTPGSVREFCDRIGVTKADNVIEMGVLESAVRDELNQTAPRAMAVLNPLKIVIENLDDDTAIELNAPNYPGDKSMGQRTMYFTREIYIERDDFMEDPPKKFFRLGPNREVRLRYGFCVTCNDVRYDDNGEVNELRCTYDPETGNGKTSDGRKVKGIIHWVSATKSARATVRLYDRLFNTPTPQTVIEDMDDIESVRKALNPESLTIVENAAIELALTTAKPGDAYQFERLGYFVVDSKDSTGITPLFNRTVTLRDTWAKIQPKK